MLCKWIRWAASVYARHLPELRAIAEPILREWVEDAELRWMSGCPRERTVGIEELEEDRVEEWTDRSGVDGRATGAARTEVQYLGSMATIADAEALGVAMAWETCDVVALDSLRVIQRMHNLVDQAPRSWVQERLARQVAERPRVLMWVKGHSGVAGDEAADARAKKEVWMGTRMLKPDICTPAGNRQASLLHSKAPKHMGWSRMVLRGLTYLVTDKGPQRQWLKEMGKTEDPSCVCDGWTPQNAAHLFICPWVGDGKGRSRKVASEDEEWCAAVARFLL